MRPEKQARIAKVTRDVLIPLAERLGVQALKTELEDLVFAILHPEEYESTRALIAAHAGERDPLPGIADSVRTVLREAGISAEVQVRPRHFVSVHRIARSRGELRGSDFGRILVLVGENADCYAVLGELHTCFTPVVSEFKDFIATPKFNLYQSLHTAVAVPEYVAEVIVRTRQMHRVAEAGVVALGNPYATATPDAGADPDEERVDPTRPGWLSRLLDWQQSAPDPDTFWSVLREELAQDREITVFRADGGTWPARGGQLHRRRLRPARSGRPRLYRRPGQRAPRLPLLPAVRRGHRAAAARPGRLLGAGRRMARPRPHPGRPHRHQQLARSPPRPCDGHHHGRTGPPVRRRARGGGANAVTDLPDATVRLAGCCTPVPPDAVAGFLVRGGAVTVHRVQCAAVAQMRAVGRTSVAVHWRATADCRVTLRAESFGRPHLLADLTEAIARQGVEVVSATVDPPVEQRVRHTYTLQLPDAAVLPALMRAMRDVPGVYDVGRA